MIVRSYDLITIPLIKRDGEFEVTQKDLDLWQDTFPGVDILASLKQCRQWNADNPKRRKTKDGIRKHITTWLAKDQDKGKNPKPPQSAPPISPPVDHEAKRRDEKYRAEAVPMPEKIKNLAFGIRGMPDAKLMTEEERRQQLRNQAEKLKREGGK